MSSNTVVSTQKTPASICGNKLNISCIQVTRGMPSWVPKKDQLPFAYDPESRAFWLYTCEGQWLNTADPLPPTVQGTVNGGQPVNQVMARIDASHHVDCVNGGELHVEWRILDSNQDEMFSGAVIIPETSGFVNLPIPNLAGGSGPFTFETVAHDYCGVSEATTALFTTA